MQRVVSIGPSKELFKGGITHFTEEFNAELESDNAITSLFIPFSRNYPTFLYKGSQPNQIVSNGWSWLNPLSYYSTAKKIKDFKPDLILFQWWTFFWGVPYILLLCLIKILGIQSKKHIIVHNVYDHEKSFFSKLLSNSTLPFFDTYTVHSKQEQNKLRDIVQKKRIVLQHMPLFNKFKNKQYKSSAQKKYDKDVLLFFGHVRPYKGLDLLLESLGLLKKKKFSFQLLHLEYTHL